MSGDQLQEKSMPELWQMAIRLGISRKGSKIELVNRIREAKEGWDILEGLKQKMITYEKTREELKALIESASRLVPRFREKRDVLEESIREDEEKIRKMDDLTTKLESEKGKLHEEIERRQEQMSEIDDRVRFISQAANLTIQSFAH